MTEKRALIEDLFFFLTKLGICILFGFLIFKFVFGIFRVPDDSMVPAVKNGDLVVYYRMQKDFRVGDPIVVKEDDRLQVRRIVAVSGDTVEITEEGLKVNGYIQQETEIYTDTLPYAEGIRFPLTVPDGSYFVLADYRENTTDSRIYGTVTEDEIQGSVLTLLRTRGI